MISVYLLLDCPYICYFLHITGFLCRFRACFFASADFFCHWNENIVNNIWRILNYCLSLQRLREKIYIKFH